MLDCKQSQICRCWIVNKVKHGNFSNSKTDNSESSGLITSIIELIQDLMVVFILTKCGTEWLILVDARV